MLVKHEMGARLCILLNTVARWFCCSGPLVLLPNSERTVVKDTGEGQRLAGLGGEVEDTVN